MWECGTWATDAKRYAGGLDGGSGAGWKGSKATFITCSDNAEVDIQYLRISLFQNERCRGVGG